MMDLDRVLEELEKIDPRKCRMVELRFFLGFTAEETASSMAVAPSTPCRVRRCLSSS
jgi:DNA-directed RNA polymerase specialized sigma24 family protein